MTVKIARLALAAAALALALGGAGLARAQQGGPVVTLPPAAHPATEKPPPAAAQTPSSVPDAMPQPDNEADADEAASSEPPPRPAPAKPAEPMKRPRYAVAVLQALDKVTAETVRFEAPIDHPVRYKSLIFTVSACETTAPDEDQSDAVAYVQVLSQPKTATLAPAPAKQVFRGWMFANAPGLHLFQHPVYDAWLIACKTASPPA
jgi:hypothetical protein